MGADQDTDVDVDGLKKLVEQYKEYFQKTTGRTFPGKIGSMLDLHQKRLKRPSVKRIQLSK